MISKELASSFGTIPHCGVGMQPLDHFDRTFGQSGSNSPFVIFQRITSGKINNVFVWNDVFGRQVAIV
jgi:hypothetical protein